jgi:hypothetical protein
MFWRPRTPACHPAGGGAPAHPGRTVLVRANLHSSITTILSTASRRQVSNLTESGEIGRFPLGGQEFLANGTSASLSLRERVGLLRQQYLSTIGVRGCHGATTSPILTSSRSDRTLRFESKISVVPARTVTERIDPSPQSSKGIVDASVRPSPGGRGRLTCSLPGEECDVAPGASWPDSLDTCLRGVVLRVAEGTLHLHTEFTLNPPLAVSSGRRIEWVR